MKTYKHMAVTCTLDRVAPLDEGTDSLGFGLNLSASFVEGAGTELTKNDLEFLKSWMWKVSSAAVWGRPKAGAWQLVDGAVAVLSPQAVTDTDPLAQAVYDRIGLQAHGGDGNLDPDRLLWDPATPPKTTDDPHHLRNLLAVLSTRSAPVPRQLGLAFLLRLPAAALTGIDEVAAVPLFDDSGALGKREPDDLANQLPTDAGNGVFTIEYEELPPEAEKPSLFAYLLTAPKELETNDFFIDLKTGWAKPEPGWAGKDWTVPFEGRAAEAFDLAQRLVDVWRQGLEDPDLRKVSLPSLREAVLAAARDRAGLGLETAPDGTGLLVQIQKDFPDAATEIKNALEAFDKTVERDTWRTIVKTALPEAAGIAAVGTPDLPRPAEQIEDELAELDRLQSVLADDANLRRLVQAQWRDALASLADAQLRNDILRRVEQLLADGSPRRLLSHQALGPLWPNLISLDSDPPPVPDEEHPRTTRDADEREELRLRLAEQLRGAFRTRLLLPGSPGKPEISSAAQTALGALKDKIIDRLNAYSEQLTKDLLPAFGDPKEGEGSITPVAHGITLQLDRLGTAGDPGTPNDRKDLQHLLAGCGALMRRKGDGEEAWRCLNMARVRLGGKGPEISAVAPVPFRLGYRNGLRETAVTYDNHPLVADSPAQRLSGDMALVDDAKATGPLLAPLISHGEVESPDGWSLLPALRFGDTYEALPFAVLNSGVLPKGLGKPDDPTAIRDFGSAELPAGNIRTFRYLRRVPVGTPRHGMAGTDPRRGELIPIPASVAPIAREVDVSGLKDISDLMEEQLPLLLLAPTDWGTERDRFELKLRKPAVDLKTWDRWIAREAGATDLRKQTWAWVHRNAPKELGETVKLDLTIDDPATEDLLYAELIPVFPVTGPKKTGFANVQRTLLSDFPKDLQSDPVSVTISIGAAGVAGTPSKLAVTVPEGEVWELRVHALVEDALYNDESRRRIHRALLDNLPDTVTRDGKAYRLQPAYRLLVEVATDGLRENPQEALWSALVPEALGSRLALRLDRAKIPGIEKWIASAEVRRQVWRWNGRPLGAFPFAETMDGPEVRAWEAKAFAEREDADCARSATAILLADPRPRLYEEDRANDARALLYRFGVEVFSRYDGLGVPRRSVRAEHALEKDPRTGKLITTPWRRLIHRCRWTEEVPKPRVKLVVPLTEARKQDRSPASAPSTPCGLPAKTGGAAGLLVVLNEPWYEIGGLAEDLRIDLDSVPDPTQQNRELPQIGPDPILTGDPWQGPQRLDFQLDGPIGHTFDTDSSAPLFVSTSFVLRPSKEVDLSWHFAKVRFRRQLEPAGSATTPANGGESKPTDPYWVQFLPDASDYSIQVVGGGPLPHLGILDLMIRNPGTGGAFDLVAREGGQRVRVTARAKDVEESKSHFIQALLVTRLIQDARGAQEEKYLGLYQFDESTSSWIPMDGLPTLDGTNLRARVVEIQERKKADVEVPKGQKATVWDKLFPEPLPEGANAGLPQDAVLRIVRVSPPIGPLENA